MKKIEDMTLNELIDYFPDAMGGPCDATSELLTRYRLVLAEVMAWREGVEDDDGSDVGYFYEGRELDLLECSFAATNARVPDVRKEV